MSVQLKSRRSFDAYLRRGGEVCPGQLVQVKYNHNHGSNGRFTYAANAVALRGGGHNTVGAGVAPKPAGPFQYHARRKGKSGDAARAMNRIVSDPNANEKFDLGGHNMNIKRTGPTTIKLSMGGGAFNAEGSFTRVPGKQAIDILVRKQGVSKLASFAMKVKSFPDHIRIFEAQNGRLVYKIDKPITARVLGRDIHRDAGVFYFDE